MLDYSRIAACFVLFNPDGDTHLLSIRQVASLGCTVLVVDNSTTRSANENQRGVVNTTNLRNIHVVSSGRNIGLSAAFNRMIDYARRSHFNIDAFVFFDQDSEVTADAFSRFIERYTSHSNETRIGVYSALAVGSDGGPYRVRRSHSTTNINGVISVQFTPSSFSLIPEAVINTARGFHDDFFIDHIDVDFCLRCRRAGLEILVDTTVRFTHEIGKGDVIIFGKRLMPLSSPYRHYYQARNIILSYRRQGASGAFLIAELMRRITAILVSGFKERDLRERLGYFTRGIRDGFNGRGGPMPQEGAP